MIGLVLLTAALAGCGSGATAVGAPAQTTAQMTGSDAVTAPQSSPADGTPGAPPVLQPTPADPPPPGGAFDPVLDLIVERINTGDTVAAAKWISKQPVTDAAREAAVITAATDLAEQTGADVSYVTTVFTDQITANKQVQQQWLDEWAAGTGTTPTVAPDLATQVRPELDRITAQLVPALAAVQDYRDDPQCAKILRDDIRATTGPASAAGQAALPVAVAHLCDPG